MPLVANSRGIWRNREMRALQPQEEKTMVFVRRWQVAACLWLAMVALQWTAACQAEDTPAPPTGGEQTACAGPAHSASAFSAVPAPAIGTATVATPTVGAAPSDFALPDVQPISCGYKAHYGLKPFVGRVTVVALLASW